ncbi:helix-turn-helix domain-containing protein [Branchiibius sp. NY16-3462-2]|uniref:helix-turn-helix domain-containing protein n=1 Tax=Branchiibius sp. NY16-3462-2 TaxID=1807500 RepID=UPI000799021A|nr:helix-turn-helix domain-containing protein [Branchiibius sp. NY16-3462-2]KYH45177.1 hypothetical protein AZH51_14970 [Branchiibius sp. NY16-3462-2]
MPTKSASAILTGERDAALARDVLQTLEGPTGELSVARDAESPRPLPRELGQLLQDVLESIASQSSVTVRALPDELTTSTAASVLGVSRPTLMKMVKNGEIRAHKVGAHTRLRREDVTAARRARRERERAAFAELLEAEGDEVD